VSERAHPDDLSFRASWQLKWIWEIFPWVRRQRNPYREAVLWRYKWADRFCRDKRVLDVPCGMGWGTSLLKSASCAVGVDISSDAVEEARRRYGGRIRFEVGSMGALAFADGAFDVVCCLEGIEHVPPEVGRAFLQEARRVLAPGGRLLLSSPYCRTRAHSGNPYHVHEYSPEEIRRAVEAHFAVEDVVEREVDIMTILYLRARRR